MASSASQKSSYETRVSPRPVRCMSPGEHRVQIGGQRWSLGPWMASVWMNAAVQGKHDRMVLYLPGGPTPYRWLRYAETDPDLPMRESHRLLAAESGLDWWVAWRLMARSWVWVGAGGLLTEWGVTPENVPLGRWLALTWRAVLFSTEEKSRELTESMLLAPPQDTIQLQSVTGRGER